MASSTARDAAESASGPTLPERPHMGRLADR
jgi:hypothetical protein